ncbi:MAG: hypothetical protein ACRCYB_06315, partial [Aeromonas veronii]
ASQGKLTPWGDQADPYFNESKRDLTRTEQSIWQAAPVQYGDQANPYTLNGSWFRDESNHREGRIRQMQQNATAAQAYQAMGGGGSSQDYEAMGRAMAAAMGGVKLQNNVTVELDGQVIGASVENHMQRSSEQVVESLSGGIAR